LPVGKEAEVTDAHEAARKQVKQEAAQELLDLQSHEPLLVAMGGVSPLEGDIARGESDQPAVGDGDAMGVCAEIAQGVFGTTEGALGVNDPVVTEQGSQPGSEDARLGKMEDCSVEVKIAFMEGSF